ncbi:MAG TPA: phosphotransferase [Rhodanobacteraceae bacterium]|nr:phosphotransferase [Rhodanobacteraceae bacterium]
MLAADRRAAERLAWARATLDDAALTLQSASSDASFRSYWRTVGGGRSLIVMDAPPAQEDLPAWLAIGARLRAAGLNAPQVHAQNLAEGFLLIADLGRRLYLPELRDDSADALYGDAMDALLRMQQAVDASDLPAYDDAFLLREMRLLPEWFLGRHLGIDVDARRRQALEDAFAVLLGSAREQPQVFVHRDFHSRNLLVTPRDNPGIIDFQGALRGPLAYDLASLLRDCYVRWDDTRVEAWAEGYRQRLRGAGLIGADIDPPRFRRWFDLIGLQRHIKVLGLFCRLHYRDGKPGYLADLPRVLGYVLDVAARHPGLASLAALLDEAVGNRDISQAAG